MPATPTSLFISYAPEDEQLEKELEKHLALLERNGLVRGWSSRRLDAGDDWRGEIDRRLDRADLILLLVSADFLASDYLFDVEMRRAITRHERGDAEVIAVILRPCDWRDAPFAVLRPRAQTLPKSGIPVTASGNHDAALADVAVGIREAMERRIRPNPRVAHPPTAPGR